MRGQGAWTGSSPLSLSGVQWNRCNTDGTGCTVVGTSNAYTVQTADTGYSLQLKISFTDPNGTTSATSALSAAVGVTTTVAAPSNTSPPTVSGTAVAGQTLTASTGTWSNSPSSYAYQWSRCDSTGSNCAAVSGANGSPYALTSADIGYTLEVSVTASNSGGSSSSTSAPTTVVQPGTQTQTFSGTLSSRSTSQSFTVAVGAGAANASLSYSKCSTSMTVALKSGGATVASATGPSVLTLSQTLSAGSYSYVVSGAAKCSFTLTVSSVAP